jgi:hypothetical protein
VEIRSQVPVLMSGLMLVSCGSLGLTGEQGDIKPVPLHICPIHKQLSPILLHCVVMQPWRRTAGQCGFSSQQDGGLNLPLFFIQYQ